MSPQEKRADTAQSEVAKPNALDAFVGNLDRGHALIVAIAAVLAAAVNLEVFLEQQLLLACITVTAALAGLAVYLIAGRRYILLGSTRALLLKRGALGLLLALIPLSVAAYFILVGGRLNEAGPIIAVAQFEGPPLPKPYDTCRPSDMLADVLSDVHERYRRVTAFELPYKVDPNGRWANLWAAAHGFLQGSDILIYGEYSLVDDQRRSGNPDRALISANVDRVPLLALGPKNAPLREWDFRTRVVPIEALCTANAERFLNDGKRLGLAIAALDLLSVQRYVAARAALNEAQRSHPDDPCDHPGSDSQCSGVLAFYLGVLDQAFGYDDRALREYRYAAQNVHRAAPFINLGELYAAHGRGADALKALNLAAAAEPDSVAVLATLAQYEFGYGDRDRAANDLARAVELSPRDGYDLVVLSRALYLAGEVTGNRQTEREARELRGRALVPMWFSKQLPRQQKVDAQVELAKWLLSTNDPDFANVEAILSQALDASPNHIEANYLLAHALTLQRDHTANLSDGDRAAYHARVLHAYLTVLGAPAFTDDDLTQQANAAADLGQVRVAKHLYDRAIALNSGNAYAYFGRAELDRRMHHETLAGRDYRRAASLRPREGWLQIAARSFVPSADARATARSAPSVTALARDDDSNPDGP